MVIFSFPVLQRKHNFWVKLVQKTKSCQFQPKFGTSTKRNNQNSVAMFTISVFNQKYSFYINLVTKIKVVSLN